MICKSSGIQPIIAVLFDAQHGNTTCVTFAAVTFNDILAAKLAQSHNKVDRKALEEMSPEEFLQHQSDVPTGPEFEDSTLVPAVGAA